MRRGLLPALLLLLSAATVPSVAAGDAALLPPDGFRGSWHRVGPPKVYEGAALYNHIDGGGEPFLEIGFESCTVQRYASEKEEAVLEIYRMADETAALGVFLAAGGSVDPMAPGSSQSTRTENQATLRKSRYYFIATSPEPRPGLADALAAMTAFAAEKVPAGAPPPVLSLLPKAVPVPGTLRLFRGPVGLQSVVTLGDGDVLLQGGKVPGAVADYAEGKSVRTVIALRFGSPHEAAAALAHLRAHLDPLLSPVKWEEGLLVFKDSQGKFGRAVMDGDRLTVTLGLSSP